MWLDTTEGGGQSKEAVQLAKHLHIPHSRLAQY